MRLVFWQNIPSFHQSATIRALASMHGCEVTLIVQDDLPHTFRDRGWVVPDFGKAKLCCPKNESDIYGIIARATGDAIHIFSGIRFPMVRKAFLAVMRTEAKIGILAEAADWRGIKGIVRLLLYRLEFLRFRSKINFILAMGQLGVRWYSRSGVHSDKIYPFTYVVEKQTSEAFSAPIDGAVSLIYVGRCIKLKGVDVLISALTSFKGLCWHLDVVGDGPELDNLKRQAILVNLIDKISFHGVMPNEAARQMIARSDFLVLPSQKDGWGAVINEALMQGVPAICSDACGAAELLGEVERGEVFKAGSVTELETVLGRWICKGKRSRTSSARIKSWSKSIEGETVAQYLLDVIDAAARITNRPSVPWRNGGYPCA